MVKKISEAIDLANGIFGKGFDKTNVIALWTEERLLKFTEKELKSLETLTKEEAIIHDSNSVTCRRLLLRIKRVREQKESIGKEH